MHVGTDAIGTQRALGIPLLKMGNIQRGFFLLDELERLPVGVEVADDDLVSRGDFLVNTRNTLALVGKGATWTGCDHVAAFNGNIARLSLRSIDTGFFNYLYNTPIVLRQVRARAAGTTSVAAIYPRDLGSVTFRVPCISEQKRIGEFFRGLDALIAANQRKCDLVKKLKQAYLQRLFPAPGRTVPELRFPGFTDAWEQRTFGELASRVSLIGGSDSKLPRVEYEDIESGQGRLRSDVSTKKSIKQGILFECGDVLFGKLRPYLKNWLMPDFQGIAVGDWWVLRPSEADSSYVYALIQSPKYQAVSNLSTGTKMPRSDWGVVSATEFAVPTDKTEQALIGAIFKSLDHLTTLHQRRRDQIEELKRGYLQKMFV